MTSTSTKKNPYPETESLSLTATSEIPVGATIAGFTDVPGTSIIVFYPKGGVSKGSGSCRW